MKICALVKSLMDVMETSGDIEVRVGQLSEDEISTDPVYKTELIYSDETAKGQPEYLLLCDKQIFTSLA